MGHQSVSPPPEDSVRDAPAFTLPQLQEPLWRSLYRSARETLSPEKLSPLQLTSRPIPVRSVWEQTSHSKAATGSLTLHAFFVAALIASSLIKFHGPKIVPPKDDSVVVVPPSGIMTAKVVKKQLSGGGGGGANEKLVANKGHLPKRALTQYTPPVVNVPKEMPKIAMDPTVVVPPSVKLPDAPNMPNLGNPMSARLQGPLSNGPGGGGGIGSGKNGGVGPGEGPGYGPGKGGGYGGGSYSLGDLGVTAPIPKYTPEPEFSEEARKAKYQGVVMLAGVIGTDGRPHGLHVIRSLGMGLDEKALEKAKTWIFEPGKRNGQPVAVAMYLEVDFRLF